VIALPIETDRLHIRGWRDGDLPAIAAIYEDPEVMRYVSIGDRTAADLLPLYRRTYAERGYGFWALCERDGSVVGDVGFHVYAPTDEPELGYTLARRAWGRGLATEAAGACVEALFASLPHERILALVDVRNDASLRVAEKIGFRRIGLTEEDGAPHHLLEVRR
jgi:RimJ/RimL family protein N-acetyltransferase